MTDTKEIERVQPMPSAPRTFQAGFVLAHKDGASRYKLTTEAIWDGVTFVSGVVTHCDNNGGFTGSYPIKASSDWFVGYVERVGSTCAACGIPGATVSCGSDGVICKNCNDVRPWSRVLADIHARRNVARGIVPEERTGPRSGGSDLEHEAVVAALTEALPANQAARRRMVAALAKEMARPVTARFPPESRLDRALPVSNGFSGISKE